MTYVVVIVCFCIACVSIAEVIYLIIPETAGMKKNEIFRMLRGEKFKQIADLAKIVPLSELPPRDENILEERSLKMNSAI